MPVMCPRRLLYVAGARQLWKLLNRAVVEYGRSSRADPCVFRRSLPAPDTLITPPPIGVVLSAIKPKNSWVNVCVLKTFHIVSYRKNNARVAAIRSAPHRSHRRCLRGAWSVQFRRIMPVMCPRRLLYVAGARQLWKLLNRAVVEYGRSSRADPCVFRRSLPAPDTLITPPPIGVVLSVVFSS